MKETQSQSRESVSFAKSRFERLPTTAKAALLVVTPAVLILAAHAACNDEGQRLTPTPTPRPSSVQFLPQTPESADSQVVEITPKIPKRTPLPTAEATPGQSSPFPSLSPEPTAPVETQKPKNYLIERGPEIPAYETHTYQEAYQIIDAAASRYPILGKIKILIALGGGNGNLGADSDGWQLIQVDRAGIELEADYVHELVHSWQDVIEKQPEIFVGSKQYELLNQIEAILADPQVGRDYPSVERIFSGDFDQALLKWQTGQSLTVEDFRVLTSNKANTLWAFNYDPKIFPFAAKLADSQLADKAKPLEDEGDPNYPNRRIYATLADFWTGEAQSLDELSQRNQYWKPILEEITKDLNKWEAIFRRLNLLKFDQQAANWWQTLSRLGNPITAEHFLGGDPNVRGLFSPDEQQTIEALLKNRRKSADGEKLAEVLSKHQILWEQQRLAAPIGVVESFMKIINDPATYR